MSTDRGRLLRHGRSIDRMAGHVAMHGGASELIVVALRLWNCRSGCGMDRQPSSCVVLVGVVVRP